MLLEVPTSFLQLRSVPNKCSWQQRSIYALYMHLKLPSMLWHCWLGIIKTTSIICLSWQSVISALFGCVATGESDWFVWQLQGRVGVLCLDSSASAGLDWLQQTVQGQLYLLWLRCLKNMRVFWLSFDYLILVLFAFVVLGSVLSVSCSMSTDWLRRASPKWTA